MTDSIGSGLPTPSPLDAAIDELVQAAKLDAQWNDHQMSVVHLETSARRLTEAKQALVRAALGEPPPTNDVTRVELIDHRHGAPSVGRVFVALGCRVELSYQDGGRTLKVFVDGEASTENVRPAPPQGSAPDVSRSLASQVGDLENEERLLRADVPELWKQIGSLQQSLWAIGEIATHMKLQNGPDWERVCAQADWERMMDLASGGLRPQGSAPTCPHSEFRHLHSTAHGIPETHMAGSERFECAACGFVVTRSMAKDFPSLTFTLDVP